MWYLYFYFFAILSNVSQAYSCQNGAHCPNLQSMLTDMNNQKSDFKMNCKIDGILCSSFSCEISANETVFKLKGSWFCQQNDPTFKLEVHKQIVKLNNINNSKVLSIGKITITPSILFDEESSFKLNLTMERKEDLTKKLIMTKREDFVMNCKCSNFKSLQDQVRSKFFAKDIACWGINSSCNTYYCAGYVEQPETIHFSFDGIGYCGNSNEPAYNLTINAFHKISSMRSCASIYFSETGENDTLTFSMEGGNQIALSLKNTFKSATKGFISTLDVDAKIENKATSLAITQIKTAIDISFSDADCSVPTKQITTMTQSTTTISTMTQSTTIQPTTARTTTIQTTTARSTTIQPTTAQSTTIQSTIIQLSTTAKPTTNKNTSNGNDDDKSSHPAKAVLIVLSVIIILSVFLVGIYLKKRKRLSNQPAYYNDIALNDPLRHELEDDELDDDDELPLFT